MDIMHRSVLNRTVYKSFPPKIYNFGVASNFHTHYIGTANIPTGETKVRVSDSGLMVYVMSLGWLSATNIIVQWPIE